MGISDKYNNRVANAKSYFNYIRPDAKFFEDRGLKLSLNGSQIVIVSVQGARARTEFECRIDFDGDSANIGCKSGGNSISAVVSPIDNDEIDEFVAERICEWEAA